MTKNIYIDKIAEDPTKFYSQLANEDTYSQLSLINQTFHYGYWLNIYKLPLLKSEDYNNTYYFDTKYTSWQTFNSKNKSDSKQPSVGQKLEDLTKYLSIGASHQGTLLKTPVWNADQGGLMNKIIFDIPLINDTSLSIQDGWILRNYKFMQNFVTGTMPVSMFNSVMQSPNLYRVLIPGKLYIHWAAVTVNVTSSGKQHKIPEFSKKLKSYGINSVSQETLWPEIWNLKITIQNLLPTSFTTYADYLIHSNGASIAGLNSYPTLSNRKDDATQSRNPYEIF